MGTSEDGSTEGISKTRRILSDVTNSPAKRSFSVFSGLKSFDKTGKNPEINSQFAKQLRSGVEKFIRENNTTVLGTEIGLSGSKEKQPCQRSSSTSTETENELDSNACKSGDFSTWTGLWNEAFRHQGEPVAGPSVTVCKDSNEGLGGSVKWSNVPNQGSQSHEFSRCINNLKYRGDVCANLNAGGGGSGNDDILKACSCSFCLKAAYIWSDLQYQDIKGRIAALKKSQREASTLAQISSKGTESDVPVKSSNLESELSGQYKSLFCHMEDVLQTENNQLQASFLMLKELRENCKTDLEIINAMPSHNN